MKSLISPLLLCKTCIVVKILYTENPHNGSGHSLGVCYGSSDYNGLFYCMSHGTVSKVWSAKLEILTPFAHQFPFMNA